MLSGLVRPALGPRVVNQGVQTLQTGRARVMRAPRPRTSRASCRASWRSCAASAWAATMRTRARCGRAEALRSGVGRPLRRRAAPATAALRAASLRLHGARRQLPRAQGLPSAHAVQPRPTRLAPAAPPQVDAALLDALIRVAPLFEEPHRAAVGLARAHQTALERRTARGAHRRRRLWQPASGAAGARCCGGCARAAPRSWWRGAVRARGAVSCRGDTLGVAEEAWLGV